MTPKVWRKKQKLTLEKLAEKVGTAKGYLSEVENGVKAPSGALITALYKLSKRSITPTDFPKQPDKEG